MDELEAQVERDDLELDGVVFNVKVAGVGRTAKDAAASERLRRGI